VVYYDEDGNIVGWGHETPQPVLLQSEPGGIRSFEPFKGPKVEWFKHRLSSTALSPLPTSSDSSPLPGRKTALDVVSHYLEQLRKSILDPASRNIGRGICFRAGRYSVLLYFPSRILQDGLKLRKQHCVQPSFKLGVFEIMMKMSA
jgi:hypothetical protein